MALPVRLRPDAAPRTQQNRVYDVVPASASSDPWLEFLPEKPEEVGFRQPIFIIVPVPSEPPSRAAQGPPHDRVLSRSQHTTANVGLFRILFRRVLSAPRRVVVWTFLALRRGVVGTFLALRRVVVGTLVALHHGVMGTLLALRRVVVGTLQMLRHGVTRTLLALRRVLAGTFQMLHRGVMGTLLALRRVVAGTFQMLHRGVMGTLLALRRNVVRALLALHRRAVATYVTARRTTSEGARWAWRSWAGVIAETTSIGISGVSRLRRLAGDVEMRRRAISRRCGAATALLRARLARELATIGRFMSMAGHHLSVVGRSFRGQIRNAQRIAIANLGTRRRAISRRCGAATALLRARLARELATMGRFMSMVGHHLSVVGRSLRGQIRNAQRIAIANLETRGPISLLRISRVRVRVTNVKQVAFAGGTAACVLVTWMLGVQPEPPRLNDRTGRNVAPAPAVVASNPSADDSVAAIYTARSGTGPSSQQSTTPSSVSASRASAMTVTSTPPGARVTVNGIGWGVTPVTIRHLPPGQKVVRVTKEGYESQQRIIRVADDRRSPAVRVALRARS